MQETKLTQTEIHEKMRLFENRCRDKGLKITPQRIEIYKALIESTEHPTADEVYRQVRREMSNISLDTVNRTLHTLTEMGVAYVVEGTGQPRRYDGGQEDHQHFRCIKCGTIIDFHYEAFDNIPVPDHLKGQFTIVRKTVSFEGICDKCTTNKQVMN